MDWNLVLIMVGIHALMFLTPGPDSLIIVSRATSQGMKHAFAAIFGIISAGIVFIPAIAFGLEFINTLSPAIWMGIRAAGALYLIYIGYKMISAELLKRRLGQDVTSSAITMKDEPLAVAYFQGLLTNLGNPKMIVLLTSFLPQFVSAELGNVSYQIFVLGLFLYLNGFLCFTVIVLAAVTVKAQVVKRFGSRNLSFVGGNVTGTTMLGIGAWMLIAPINLLFSSRVR